MDYLARESSPLTAGLWEQIDSTVVSTARNVLTGRRFLHVFGPLGIGTQSISVDNADAVTETESDGIITTKGRKYLELPTLFEDFSLLARDLENSAKLGYPLDLSKAAAAAAACALKEDKLIFFGNDALGYEGLFTAPGANKIKRGDWKAGETPFADAAAALETLTSNGIYGTYALCVSPDLYLQMQRIQPGTGLLELDRVAKLLNGNVFTSPALGTGKAVVVCSEAGNMDLAVGQDMAAAYLEQKELNHSFRVLETVLLRIKRSKAIVVLE